MKAKFKIPDYLVEKIEKSGDNLTDSTQKKRQESLLATQNLKSLRSMIIEIVGNEYIKKSCEGGALLIKQISPGYNLYLGGTSLCFFLDHEGKQDNKEFKPHQVNILDTISTKRYIHDESAISTADELNQLVIVALEKKYITATKENLVETLGGQ